MAKLSKKSDVVKTTSIHSIAKQLRGGEHSISNISQESEKIEKVENAKASQIKSKEGDLITLFEVLKNNSYNCKSILYVDDEIKEVFALIKSKEKISISTLVSYILEDWIKNNLDEITAIINNNNNRFL